MKSFLHSPFSILAFSMLIQVCFIDESAAVTGRHSGRTSTQHYNPKTRDLKAGPQDDGTHVYHSKGGKAGHWTSVSDPGKEIVIHYHDSKTTSVHDNEGQRK